MPKRERYFINPRDDGKWEITKQGSKKASAVTDTKRDAVRKGAQIARSKGNSQLHIKKKDGTFQEERTYGKDPYPPPG